MSNPAETVLAYVIAVPIIAGVYALITLALQYGLSAGFGMTVGFWPLAALVFVAAAIFGKVGKK